MVPVGDCASDVDEAPVSSHVVRTYRAVIVRGLATACLAASPAACGGGHLAGSTTHRYAASHATPTAGAIPSPAYLDCETAANVARSSLADAFGSFAPGNIDQLIA